MCKHPAIRAPFRGWVSPYSSLKLINPGISASAKLISFLPQSAKEISLTLYGTYAVVALIFMYIYILFLEVQSYDIEFKKYGSLQNINGSQKN